MDAVLTEFAEVLRQNGVKVSTAELEDAARALAVMGVDEKETVRAALAATLVKREQDRDPFQRAFGVYFSGAIRTLEALDRSLAEQIDAQGLLEGDELAMVLAWLPRTLAQGSPLLAAVAEGNRGKLAQLLRGAMLQLDLSQLQSPLQTSFYGRRLAAAAGMDRARADAEALAAELRQRGVSDRGVEVVSRHLGERLRALEALAREELGRQASARLKPAARTLWERAFQTLSPQEILEAQTAVGRLAERLKSRWTRKERVRRKGVLNVRRTMRKNMAWGGIPMLPQLRGRRPQRPEVVVLCDVSESVRSSSRLMLLFLYSLQSLFARVRSFVFVSDLGEVTEQLKDATPEEAVDVALSARGISLQSNSNYGRALASFVSAHGASVTRRTTVIVMGDGRNNHNPPHLWALQELKQRARRVLWISPEPRLSWGLGDSELLAYERACSQVIVVQSLEDLTRLADRLLPD